MIRKPLIFAAAISVTLLGCGSARAEEGTIRAFAIWEADGNLVRTGPVETTMIGTISGDIYVDTDQGPVDAGEMACPVVVHQDLKNLTQKGEGKCTFKGPKGNLWFMSISCSGVPLVGCSGESMLTGGTGPFDKVTGGGRFVIRSNMLELARQESSPGVTGKVKGIIFWNELRYKTP